MFPVIQWNLISLESLITLVLVGLVVLDIALPKTTRRGTIGFISFIALAGLFLFWLSQCKLSGETFGGMFRMDSLAWFFKSFFLVTMAFVFAMTRQYFKNITAGSIVR